VALSPHKNQIAPARIAKTQSFTTPPTIFFASMFAYSTFRRAFGIPPCSRYLPNQK
jgi:hypothetical protein